MQFSIAGRLHLVFKGERSASERKQRKGDQHDSSSIPCDTTFDGASRGSPPAAIKRECSKFAYLDFESCQCEERYSHDSRHRYILWWYIQRHPDGDKVRETERHTQRSWHAVWHAHKHCWDGHRDGDECACDNTHQRCGS